MAVALLLAAGRGERLGFDRPKALVPLGGRPLLQWSLDVLAACAGIESIVVALPPDVAEPSLQLPANAMCVAGGAVRSASVRRALQAAGEGDPVLVHDAARPLLSSALVERCLAAAMGAGVDGAVAAAPVTDTVKRASSDDPPVVQETLDRSVLWAIQTPQVFRRDALRGALDVPAQLLVAATDDAWLVERAGGTVTIVPSGPENIKVTTPTDMALAEMLLARRGD